jgi:hypothetical protein
VKAIWGRALAGEEFTAIDEFGDPSRDRRFYEMRFNALRDAEGKQIGAYQFVYDVTERLRDQERLRHAEQARAANAANGIAGTTYRRRRARLQQPARGVCERCAGDGTQSVRGAATDRARGQCGVRSRAAPASRVTYSRSRAADQ